MTTLTTATQRVLQLPHTPAAAEAYRAIGVSTTLSLDDGAALIVIAADGAAALVQGDHPPQATDSDGAAPGVDVEMSLSSADVLSLADGDLTVLRALTTSRAAARGPIFAAIGVLHALTHL